MKTTLSNDSATWFGRQKKSRSALRRACQAVARTSIPALETLEQRQMLAADPVAHFPLDGDTFDLSGNYLGVMTDAETYTAGRIGANALSFNGATSMLVVDGTGQFANHLLGGTASISTWIKTTQVGSDLFWQAPGIAGWESPSNNNDIFWGYLDGSGRIALHVGNDGEVKSKAPVNDGAWHHVVMTRDINYGSPTMGEIKIYVDGLLQNKVTTPATEQDVKTGDYSEFGAIPSGPTTRAYLKGALDDIRVYNQVLTDQDVQNLFFVGGNVPTGVPAAPTNLTVDHTGARGVRLKWNDNASNESYYEIYRAPAGSSTFTLVGYGASGSYADVGLTPETGYRYQVRAVNSYGSSVYSNIIDVTTTKLATPGNGTGLLGIYYDNGGQSYNDAPDPNQLFTGSMILRTDKNIAFSWGTGAPDSRMGVDQFTVRWLGQVQAMYTENYNFYTMTDDGAFFYIKGVTIPGLTPDAEGWYKIINDPTYHGATADDEKSSKTLVPGGVPLVAGQKYDIKMEMFEGDGDAAAFLSWDSVSQAKENIPQTQLFAPTSTGTTPAAPSGLMTSLSGSTIRLSWQDNASNELGYKVYRSVSAAGPFVLVAHVAAGSGYDDAKAFPGQPYYYQISAFNLAGESARTGVVGPVSAPRATGPVGTQGLWGHYYNSTDWSGSPVLEKVDATVDFSVGDGVSPATGVNSDFSVIWTGQVIAPQTGTYTFVTSTDDHGELWVNGVRVSYDPGGHGERDASDVKGIALEAGKAYSIIFLQNDTGGGGGAHLKWKGPGIGNGSEVKVIEAQYLRPQSPTAAPPLAVVKSGNVDRITTRTVDLTGFSGWANELERATKPDFSDAVLVGVFPYTQGTFRNAGLQPNSTYYYRARTNTYEAVSDYAYVTVTTLVTEPVLNAPTNLNLTRRIRNRIELRWTDNSINETGFRIERKTGAEGAWQTIATVADNVTFYADTNLTNGTDYYYRVWAANDLIGDVASNIANGVSTYGDLPTGWMQEDIGLRGEHSYTDGTANTGYVSVDDNPLTNGDGTFEVQSNGGETWWEPWYPVNRFNYVYREFTGDGEIIVRVADSPSHDWAKKAGPMFRESLEPGSKYAAVAVMEYGDMPHLWRGTTVTNEADLTQASENTWWEAPNAPIWLKLTRRGDTFTSYYSYDGVTWNYRYESNVVMPLKIYVGLMAQSHNPWETRIMKFDNVQVTEIPVVPPAAPTDVAAVAISNKRVVVTWTDKSDNETGFAIERATSLSGPWTSAGTAAGNAKSFIDTGATAGTQYYYRVRAVNKGGESAWVGTSNPVTPAQGDVPVASPWQSTDVGSPTTAGNSGQLGTTFDVTGAGDDIWTNGQDTQGGTRPDHYAADQFHFVYQETTGDFMIQGQVAVQQRQDGWSKAGFMIRAKNDAAGTLQANKAAAFVFAGVTPDNGLSMQWRWNQDDWCDGRNTGAGNGAAPYYFRLVKSGDLYRMWVSPTGQPGTYVRYAEDRWLGSIGNTVYVGMAVTSHNANAASTSIFSNVYLGGLTTNVMADAATNVTVSGLGGSILVTWTDQSLWETGYRVERSAKGDFTDTEIVGVAGANVTALADRNVEVNKTYTYRVVALNSNAPAGQQESPASAPVSGSTTGEVGGPFNYTDFNATDGLQINGDASATGGRLRLTNDEDWKSGSVFTRLPRSITKFQTSFDFQLTNSTGADGFAFVLQGIGATARGNNGGDLGYAGIPVSAAIKFDIYNGDETGLYFQGWHPDSNDDIAAGDDVDLRGIIDIDGGTTWRVTLSYDGAKLTQTIADAANPSVILFTHEYTVDLPAALGTNYAYVGFTAGTGGAHARQEIVNWSWSEGSVANPMVITGTAGADILYFKLEGDTINVYANATGVGTVLMSRKAAEVTGIQFDANDGNDLLIFNLGTFDRPVSVDAGAGTDTIQIIGSTVVTATNHEILASGNSLTLVAGSPELGANVTGKSVTIQPGVTAVATADLSLAGLVVEGTLDLKTFDVTVAGGNADTLAGYVQSGAIKSTSITSITTLGVIPQAGGVLVKYTYYGDVNGDGSVNLSDYFVIDSGYLNKRSGFANGDMNYDGEINLNDYFLIDSAYLNQGTPLATPAAAQPKAVFSKTPIAKKVKAKKAKPAKKAKKA